MYRKNYALHYNVVKGPRARFLAMLGASWTVPAAGGGTGAGVDTTRVYIRQKTAI